MTSEEAVILVAELLDNQIQGSVDAQGQGPGGLIPKWILPFQSKFEDLMASADKDRPYPADAMPGSEGRCKGSWVFKDQNAATHLVRNSIGDGDEKLRRQMMSAVGDAGVREARDDVTAV